MTDTPSNVKTKVLIVGDDPSIVRILSVHCAELGLEVQTAENGLQAILRATRNPPRVVILDLQMPEADGFRVCKRFREPNRPFVDIIVLTGRSDIETIDRCKSLGVFYVPKGPDSWKLVRSILGEILGLETTSAPSPSVSRGRAIEPKETLGDQLRNKVLIVDDDSDLATGIARRLKKCGAITLIASDGVSGYRIAVREQPDVIVTDYAMPDGSGHYMIWRLKSTESTKRIPIIVISGQKPDLDRSASPAGLGGPVKHFQKPLDVDALLNEVGRHCVIQYSPFETVS